jgi:phosphopantothenoylcysteine synthetase/decarboxylase
MARLNGRHLMITSGPTRAPLDAVRYLTNKSSGRLGSLIALEALRHGARVTFVHGRDSLTPAACGVDGDSRERVRMIEVETVADLIGALRAELPGDCDAIVHAMAVLDFEPESAPDEKISSRQDEWLVRLRPTPKAVAEIRDLAPDAVLVSFKLVYNVSVEEMERAAAESARRYRSDLIVGNDLAEIERGRHVAHLLNGSGLTLARVEGKREIAAAVVEAVAGILQHKA